MKWICFCIIALLLFTKISGQKKEIKFHTIGSGGITSGKRGSYGMFQLTNGIMYNKWFTGIGSGYDYYRYRTVPLFFDVKRFFGKQNNLLFDADLGYSFPQKDKPGKEIFYYSSYHFTGGVYTSFNIGYKINLFNNAAILLTTGYTYKEIVNKIGVINPCLIGPCPEDFSKYKYTFGTILIKGAIDFKW